MVQGICKNPYMVRGSLPLDSVSDFNFCYSIYYKNISLYSAEDGLISSDPGDEEPEEGSSENVVSGNEAAVPEESEEPEEVEEPEESEEIEDTVSDNTVSNNETTSGNEVSCYESPSENEVHHATENNNPWEGEIIITCDPGLDEYMPTVIDLLAVIGGCCIFIALCQLLKYIYKFFRVFF